MGQFLLLLVVALTVAAVVFGVTVLVSGGDPGLVPAEPDGRAVPLPGARPLQETDVSSVRFDTAVRGYRMAQVDQALRRAAYDIGYKDELIGVLEAEVVALREGRVADADSLRRAREAALVPAGAPAVETAAADGVGPALSEVTPVVSEVTVGAAEPAPGAPATADRAAAGPTAADSPGPAAADSADHATARADDAGADARADDAGADRPADATASNDRAPTSERG